MKRPPSTDPLDPEKRNGASAPASPAGRGHNVNGGEHDYTPDEIEALRDSCKAAAAPRPKRILPRPIFEQIGKATVRIGRYRVHLHCALRALADQRLAPRHEAVLIALALATNRTSGATYAGRTYLEAMTGFDENTLNVILSDLRKWGYIATARFAEHPGGPARSHHVLLEPTTDEIEAFVKVMRLGFKAARKAQETIKDSLGDKAIELADLNVYVLKDSLAELNAMDVKDSSEPDQPDLNDMDVKDSGEHADATLMKSGADLNAKMQETPENIEPAPPNLFEPEDKNAPPTSRRRTGELFGDEGAAERRPTGSKKQQKATLADRLFPEFAKRYPRRPPGAPSPIEAVDAIKRELGRLVGGGHVTARALLAATEHFARNPGKFIPSAENWLKDGRWRHHVEAVTEAATKPAAPALDPATMSDAVWDHYLKRFFETGAWEDWLKAKPHEPGCLAPKHRIRHHEAMKGATP